MAKTWVEYVTGPLADKKRYKLYQSRKAALPGNYRAGLAAVERYTTYFGAIAQGDVLVQMLEDLVELFEQSAADGVSVRGIVGEDPVTFAEEFMVNYSEGQWINKERARFIAAIDAVADGGPAAQDPGQDPGQDTGGAPGQETGRAPGQA